MKASTKTIVERYYQEESIRAVTEHFAKMQRKSLDCYGNGRGQDANRYCTLRVAAKMQLDQTSSVPCRSRCARETSCECFQATFARIPIR